MNEPMQYQRIVIRNIEKEQLLTVAAEQLHNYYQKWFSSWHVNFVTSGNAKGYMLIITSDQPIEDDTLYLCLGYTIRVIEEQRNLFNV